MLSLKRTDVYCAFICHCHITSLTCPH